MPEYSYEARDRSGRPVEGTIVAANSALAAGKVRELGFTPEKLRAVVYKRQSSIAGRFAEIFIYPVVSGVKLKELAQFYRQFATMIDAGIPLYQSLVTLEGQCTNKALAGVLREFQRQVQDGRPISEVMAAHPWIFSELQVQMIRAAEQGGMLDRMLIRIADYLEQEMALRRLISGLTIYPKLVAISAVLILGRSFLVDLMPAISKLIVGQLGKSSYGVADYLNDSFGTLAIILIGIFLVVAFCRIFLFQSESAREGYEHLKMGLPGIGTVARGFALAKFGRAFGAMYEAGLPLNTAIRVAGDASGSRIIAHATGRAILASERGAPLSQAFRETGVFPHLVIDMLHTGEQTGNLDAMMSKVAEYLEGDAESKARLYAHIFATVIYLFVAILVAVAVIRFYMGYVGGAMGGGTANVGTGD